MKINFNLLTCSSDWPYWVDQLQQDFFEYHHVDSRTNAAKIMMQSPEGCRLFVEWCRQQNYDVAYWELDYTIPKTDPKMPIAFGIDINETCPYLVEYRLKG